MADEGCRRYPFVAIDRATRWVFIRVYNAKTAANARRFLRDLERACPMQIRTILTDNGKEFTDRLFGLHKRAATGEHAFDTLCAALDIEHRLTPPKSLRTNGTVEPFNIEHRPTPPKSPGPTARSSPSTAGLRRCCKVTTPDITRI